MKFITGNKSKFEEMSNFLPNLEQLELDLPEIQELDTQKVIEAKLKEAQSHVPIGTELIVEDTSVIFHEMNTLPGPFIKWFLRDLGLAGIWELAQKFKNRDATAITVIGYLDPESYIHYFRGDAQGKIIEPRGIGFGWNPLFQVSGSDKNFTEMNQQEKEQFSMRAKAAKKLKAHLENR